MTKRLSFMLYHCYTEILSYLHTQFHHNFTRLHKVNEYEWLTRWPLHRSIRRLFTYTTCHKDQQPNEGLANIVMGENGNV